MLNRPSGALLFCMHESTSFGLALEVLEGDAEENVIQMYDNLKYVSSDCSDFRSFV